MSAVAQPDYTQPVGIRKKMLAIMAACSYIQKDKRNDFHKYNYASEAAIKTALHKAMVDNGIIPQFDILEVCEQRQLMDKEGRPGKEWLTTIRVAYKFSDIDSQECIEGTFLGSGVDNADKGIYKAVTGAIKYILTSQFLIPTGDDPEGEERPTRATQKQAAQDVAQREIAKGRQRVHEMPPSAPPFSDPEPPLQNIHDYEDRTAATTAEAENIAKDAKGGTTRKRGGVSFTALKALGEIKKELREWSGSDTIYYTKIHGCGHKHADEITQDSEARTIYKLLAMELNRLKADGEAKKVMTAAREVLGSEAFASLCAKFVGPEVDVLNTALIIPADEFSKLLAALKSAVDLKNSQRVDPAKVERLKSLRMQAKTGEVFYGAIGHHGCETLEEAASSNSYEAIVQELVDGILAKERA